MTEAEWLTCTNPQPMLDFLGGRASDRKLRLFACACTRRASSPRLDWTFIEVAERLAEGVALPEEIERATSLTMSTNIPGYRRDAVEIAIAMLLSESASASARAWCLARYWRDEHAGLVRDIFGSPFRPVTIDPHWHTGPVTALAKAIYNERAFDRLPILADALEDAGCHDADILAHCRGPGPHVRGCWVVDLLLGKS